MEKYFLWHAKEKSPDIDDLSVNSMHILNDTLSFDGKSTVKVASESFEKVKIVIFQFQWGARVTMVSVSRTFCEKKLERIWRIFQWVSHSMFGSWSDVIEEKYFPYLHNYELVFSALFHWKSRLKTQIFMKSV